MTFKPGDQHKVSNFEQRLIDLTERFDPFLEKYDREHPMLFRDRIAREAYPLFSGLTQKQNIWHAGLGPQAGISEWKGIQISSTISTHYCLVLNHLGAKRAFFHLMFPQL